MTQQNAALVEQASAAAQALAEQANSLRDAVAVFRLRDESMLHRNTAASGSVNARARNGAQIDAPARHGVEPTAEWQTF